MKKTAVLSSSLVATKGKATPAAGVKGRQVKESSLPSEGMPLNFKVDSEFRRRFRRRAAEADLKLNQLLRQSLDAWEKVHGIKE